MLFNQDSGLMRKIRLYLVGLVIGGLISYFLLYKDRDLSYWTPERQVTGRLKMYLLKYMPLAECQMKCTGFTEADLKSRMDSASVDFKNSDTDHRPCPIYSVHTKDGINVKAQLCDDSTAVIFELRGKMFEKDTCKCNYPM